MFHFVAVFRIHAGEGIDIIMLAGGEPSLIPPRLQAIQKVEAAIDATRLFEILIYNFLVGDRDDKFLLEFFKAQHLVGPGGDDTVAIPVIGIHIVVLDAAQGIIDVEGLGQSRQQFQFQDRRQLDGAAVYLRREFPKTQLSHFVFLSLEGRSPSLWQPSPSGR
ncbi:hypothetical protein ES703_60517 [subsurface metagenome]